TSPRRPLDGGTEGASAERARARAATMRAAERVADRPNGPHANMRRRSDQAVCLLCGALVSRASPRDGGARRVCAGCAERLEVELSFSEAAVCPDCGRHRELCMLMPCNLPPAHPTPARAPRGLVVRMQRR